MSPWLVLDIAIFENLYYNNMVVEYHRRQIFRSSYRSWMRVANRIIFNTF